MDPLMCQSVYRRRGTSGSVLILSLWVLALLFLLGTSLAYRMRMELQLSQGVWNNLRCMQLAKAAVDQCASFWQGHATPCTSFNQPWYQNGTQFKEHALLDGTYTVIHDGIYGVEDESARVNVNRASVDVLKRLFGANAFIVPAILQWRSASGDNSAYNGLCYTSRQGPLKSIEELLLVKGMTPEIYESVKKDVTVYSSGGVNINTASERVLLAMGLPNSLVSKILTFREGPDGITGTEDDGVFNAIGGIIPVLKKRFFLTDPETQILMALIQNGELAVQSDYARLDLIARLNNATGLRHFVVVFFAHSHAARILYWREIVS